MLLPRRRFLGSSMLLLGSALTEALAEPLHRWTDPDLLQTLNTPASTLSSPPVQFVDVARQAGVTAVNVWGGIDHKRSIIEAKGSGLAFYDFDHDGWLDIYLTNGDRLDTHWPAGKTPTSHLYKNNRDGTFTDVTERSGLGLTGWQTGVCVGDYNNDGFDDLFCTFWGQNRLMRNNGNGTFTDVTKAAGLLQNRVRWGAGCTFLDFDRDGHLDLFVCNYLTLDPASIPPASDTHFCQWKGVPIMCGPRGLPGDTNILYHNNGDGTFTDVSEKAGILKPGPRYSITSVSYDFDNDGWPDLYIAVDSQPSILFQNNHDGTFTDIAVGAGCAYSDGGHEQAGMGVGVADYDCSGNFSIFKTNFADDTSNLYHNDGKASFTDVTFPAGTGVNDQYVGWGCGFLDFDNDGWKDVIQVNGHVYPEIDSYHFGQTFKNPRLVYRNLGNGRFKDVSAQMGPGITEHFSSRGAAFGDYDNDGGMDALVLNMNDAPSLLHNMGGGSAGNWIKLKLIGTHSNRSAIGARARITTGKHVQMEEVASGGSVMSQSDLRLHFGLGTASYADSIEITWPTTGKIERFPHVKCNQILTIREGDGIIATLPGAIARIL
jgi:hypothetical protein